MCGGRLAPLGESQRKPNKDAREPNRLIVLFALPRRTNRGSFDRQISFRERRVHHMKRMHILVSFFTLGAVIVLGMFLLSPRQTQAQGLAGSPEQQAAQAHLEEGYPKLQ